MMKTIFKSITLIVLWMIVAVACGPDCGGSSNYKITSYAIKEFSGTIDAITNELVFDPVESSELESSDSVRYILAGFQVNPEIQVIAKKAEAGFVTSAVACSPADPDPSQKYSAIEIVSNANYVTSQKTYAAGESLKEIFALHDSEGNSIDDELINSFAFESGFLLVLKTAPNSIQPHKFTITISMDDGANLVASTETIAIKP